MQLIRKTKVTFTKSGNRIQWALFLCPFCLQIVERQISSGKRNQSCGCERANLVSKKLKGRPSEKKGKNISKEQNKKLEKKLRKDIKTLKILLCMEKPTQKKQDKK